MTPEQAYLKRKVRERVKWDSFLKDCKIIAQTHPKIVLVMIVAEVWGSVVIARHMLETMSIIDIVKKLIFLD
jgi:hypothetical protein